MYSRIYKYNIPAPENILSSIKNSEKKNLNQAEKKLMLNKPSVKTYLKCIKKLNKDSISNSNALILDRQMSVYYRLQ